MLSYLFVRYYIASASLSLCTTACPYNLLLTVATPLLYSKHLGPEYCQSSIIKPLQAQLLARPLVASCNQLGRCSLYSIIKPLQAFRWPCCMQGLLSFVRGTRHLYCFSFGSAVSVRYCKASAGLSAGLAVRKGFRCLCTRCRAPPPPSF